MNNIYILKEIARWDRKVWRLFSLLNKEMNEYFNVKGREYEMCFRRIKIDKYKTCYKLDGKRHRSDVPAVIYKDCEFWYDSRKEWYFNGKIHRLDGPAIVWKDGSNEWLVNGELHRTDGPARILVNYCTCWYINGKLHRLDGPAVEFVREDMKIDNQWWVDGVRIKKK